MVRRHLNILGIVATTIILASCGTKQTNPVPGEPIQLPPIDFEAELQQLVESVVAESAIPGALLAVSSPRLGLDWEGAAGIAEITTARPLTTEAPLRIASNTKTLVAVTILRLWETGHLDLDDPITRYLDAELATILSNDGYDLDAITLRHLLTHTAGLIDHAAMEPFFQEIEANPNRRWLRRDHIQGAADWGDPLGPPEVAFSYSDTGYVLLGAVVEKVTDLSLAAAVRKWVGFEQLGLSSTWWETEEGAPTGIADRAHQYIGEQDSYDWDPSFDLYGGGGLVSTMGDLIRFWRGLFHGEIFTDPTTLDTLLTTPIKPVVPGYRMGVFERDFDGLTVYEHSGFWGTGALYVPDLDLTIAGAITQQEEIRELLGLVRRAFDKVRALNQASPTINEQSS